MTIPPLLRSARFLWLCTAVLVLLGTLYWARQLTTRLDNAALLQEAGSFTVMGMNACVVAMLAGAAALAPNLRALLGARRLWIALGLAALGYLACGLAPKLNRILFDEHIYMQIGQTIAHTGRAECATYAKVEYGNFDLISGGVNKQPNGLPYLHSLVYRVFGVSTAASHQLNRVLIGLAAAGLYLALCLLPWRLPKGAGLAAALLFIFTPLVPWWGHTTAVEPGAVATVVTAFFAACLYVRLRDGASIQGTAASALFLAGATAFAVYFRPESLLVLPLVAAVLWADEDRFLKDFFAWAALALVLALILPNLLHLWAVRGENWGATDGRRFDFAFIGKNFRTNAGYFFTSEFFPLAGAIMAIFGFTWLLVRNLAAALVLALWFALSWGIFVLFYAGSYHYGASSRYALVSCAPVAACMGVGAAWLVQTLRHRPLFGYVLAAGLGLNWITCFAYVPTETREAAGAREDIRFVVRQAAKMPHASLVISRAPTVWLVEGVNACELAKIEESVRHNLRELVNQYPGGIYFHFGYWDNVEPAMANMAVNLLVGAGAAEVERRRCQEHVFALFRLDTPEGIARFGGQPPEYPDRLVRLDALMKQAQAEAQAAAPKADAPPATPPETPLEHTLILEKP